VNQKENKKIGSYSNFGVKKPNKKVKFNSNCIAVYCAYDKHDILILSLKQ
jgi:hypothetical protein